MLIVNHRTTFSFFRYLCRAISKLSLDTAMNWGAHVEATLTKINQRLGLLKRISYLLSAT